MKKMFNEGNQIHYFMSSSGSGTVFNYGSGSDFLTSYGFGSGSTSQKVTVPTVPVPQHWLRVYRERPQRSKLASKIMKKLLLFNSLCCRHMKSTVKVKNATP
jgi:hypothetical protein